MKGAHNEAGVRALIGPACSGDGWGFAEKHDLVWCWYIPYRFTDRKYDVCRAKQNRVVFVRRRVAVTY